MPFAGVTTYQARAFRKSQRLPFDFRWRRYHRPHV